MNKLDKMLDWSAKHPLKALGSLLLILFVVVSCTTKLKVNAYNNATGSDVSWWDAMWVPLRIEEEAK